MSRTEKHPVHCNCIDKNIQINVIYIKEQGVEVVLGKTCQELIELTPNKCAKEPIHNCEFENTENCSLKDYK